MVISSIVEGTIVMKKKLLATALTMCILLVSCLTIFGALTDEREKEHIYTNEELACMNDLPTLDTICSDDGLSKITKTAHSNRETISYFIIERSNGLLLTSPSGGGFSRTRYSSGSGNSHIYQKWNFVEVSSGDYIVYPYANNNYCLTVDPSTKIVGLSPYSPLSNYQTWNMYFSGNGNALVCSSSDSAVDGWKLIISDTNLRVASNYYSGVGFFDVDWYVPTTGLSHETFTVTVGQSTTVHPTLTPSNANCTNGWINWSVGNASFLTFSNPGTVNGMLTGVTTLTFEDKITCVRGSCKVAVAESGAVGIMTIFSTNEGSFTINDPGHAFVSFMNVSSSSIVIGGLTVQPNHEITLGTWQSQNHDGIFYNLDAYLINNQNVLINRKSISGSVDLSSISSINTTIANNDTWNLFHNCTWFAIEMWNSFSSSSFSHYLIDSPSGLWNAISSRTGSETGRAVENAIPVGYCSGGVFVQSLS